MRLHSIKAINFRNLENIDIQIDKRHNFLIGDNGQGKTNFIEAIYFCCFGSSFRTNINKRIIKEGEKEAFLECSFVDEEKDMRKIKIRIHENKNKEIRIDNKNIVDRVTLIENTACIVFAHDDMIFVNGPPDKKRQFLNQTISLIEPRFIDMLRQYNYLLKNRNKAFKDRNDDIAVLYDEKLVETGLVIQKKRQEGFREYSETFSRLFSEISKTDFCLSLVYKPSWKSDDYSTVLDQVKQNFEKDKLLSTTMTGPHRDSFDYIVNGNNFSFIASTGQMRLIALLLKVSQLLYVRKKTNKKPLVLLDDVLLELDQEKRNRFIEMFDEYEQAFFTFLPNEKYTMYVKEDTKLFHIEQGAILEWNEPVRS